MFGPRVWFRCEHQATGRGRQYDAIESNHVELQTCGNALRLQYEPAFRCAADVTFPPRFLNLRSQMWKIDRCVADADPTLR